MAIAIALVVIVLGSVLFHLASPWWTTPLASNWQSMDDTLTITLAVTGVFFVAINLFVVFVVLRYRHRAGRRAAYEPENPRLERWLIGATSIGIVGLLAPGLVVYADYVRPPRDALEVEVLALQWQWRYRFPGAGARLGGSDARFVSAANPWGLDPGDAQAQDDVLVADPELHLPLNRPVKVQLRSHDVLHDFFVPQFRARLNIVPGQVGSFWFTPTEPGRFEAMCAQLCGVGHPRMRGLVVVEDEAAWRAWLERQPRFAALGTRSAAAPSGGPVPLVAQGRALAQAKGCAGCHSIDDSPSVGPGWKGLFGKTETMKDGSTARVDEAYLKAFIRDPQARGVRGYPPVMPRIALSEAELEALVAYIRSLGVAPAVEARP